MGKTIYICTGGCNGVSPAAKNCGASDCAHFNQPLEPRIQCASCEVKTEQDGKPCACGECAK